LADGRRVRLGDIATVRDTAAERRQLALLNGKPVVSFQLYKSKGSSELRVAEGVRAVLARLAAEHPHIKITEISSRLKSTEAQYDTAMRALYEGGLLTLIVVWLFLRDARSTWVAAVALPLSIIPTFLVMHLVGYTLNTVTLLALTLVIGFLVDDAIVEVENIIRHLSMGKTPRQAALEAADEIGLAVIATSLTLIAVFLPTAFMGGVAGKVFQQFGWTASVAGLCSLLVARLLTPMMAAYWLKATRPPVASLDEERLQGFMMRGYLWMATWCLANPFKTIAMALAFFVLSLALAARLSQDFIPVGDAGEITVTVSTPPGTPIDSTAAVAEAARLAAMQESEVASVYTSIGVGTELGGDASGEVNSATLLLTLKDERSRSQQAVEAALRKRFAQIPGARFALGAGEAGEKFSLALTGDDPTLLLSTAYAVVSEMRRLLGFGNVSTSASLLQPEIVIRPDPVRAADLGVTTQAIAQVLRVATNGDFDTHLAKLNLPSRQIPIRVRLDQRSRDDLETLTRLHAGARQDRDRGPGQRSEPINGERPGAHRAG
jgi:multidrug efflux pump subunit AcrB